MPKTKKCTNCQKRKAISKFSVVKTNKDGYRNQCKPCFNIIVKQYTTILRYIQIDSPQKKLYPKASPNV